MPRARFEKFFPGLPVARPMACERSESVCSPAQDVRAAMFGWL